MISRRQRQAGKFEANQSAFYAHVWRKTRPRFFSLACEGGLPSAVEVWEVSFESGEAHGRK
ncbi:hypothetical protein D8I24_3132 (plasmid) [Cupriavidus necator H850]|nr:hypothetical protein D8I24_3132 [Cupriavidus necator H850]